MRRWFNAHRVPDLAEYVWVTFTTAPFRHATIVFAITSSLFVFVGRAQAQISPPPPAWLNNYATTDNAIDESPYVTTDGVGHWVAVWWSNATPTGTITYTHVMISRSADNGATWTQPAFLSNYTANTSDGTPRVAADRAGHWVAVWSGYIGPCCDPNDILVSRSNDNGATWTPVVTLNTNAATDSGRDYDPQVTTDGAGNWITVWSSNESFGGLIGTDGDILISRSTDNGVTWTPPAALNTNAAIDSSIDAAPQVATDGAGHWVAVWASGMLNTDSDILVSRSTDNGATWTAPAALNSNATTDAGVDTVPAVATDGAGNWIAVWTGGIYFQGPSYDFEVAVSLSTDNGATWSPLAPLNTDAATDPGNDAYPQITTDGAGHWVTVWTAFEPTFRDTDIRFTRWLMPIVDPDNLFVDFNAVVNGIGAETSPLNTLTEAVGMANDGATINMAPGLSPETFIGMNRLGGGNQSMVLRKYGAGVGPARVGAP